MRTSRGVFAARVAAQRQLCAEHYRLTLSVPGFPASRPGQFIQLLCRPPYASSAPRELTWGPDSPPQLSDPELIDRQTMLRRPISLAGRRDSGDASEIDLIYRVVGTATRWLTGAEPGAELSVLGPLGNGFAPRGAGEAVLIGGGVGIPPLLYLAETLADGGTNVTAIFGARSEGLMPLRVDGAAVPREPAPSPCIADLPPQARAVLTTDDGTLGVAGTASDALLEWLRRREGGAAGLTAYCCGPEPLMRAVADICIERNLPCQLALERYMACGMGTCQSCVVKVRDTNAENGWAYKLCCTDGPVFEAADLLW
ncbi:MAG: dihydroorotate dehydrogenase electron transfer subunit [Phycisphaerae bacterium]|nr:dihydroorotate dehydrogenase electron transfer subunit [Phycisphaerae bacterium]